MNILEILDAKVTNTKSNYKFKDKYRELSPATKAGAYGRVHNIQDPHQIIKKPHVSVAENIDGYFSYIKYIVDNKIAEHNPFAPRVYDIKIIEDAAKKFKYSIKMEKLVSLRSFDNEVIYEIGKQLYGEYFYSYVRKNKVEDEGLPIPELMHTLRALSYAVRDNCYGKLSSTSKELNELCNIINKIAKDTNKKIDTRSENIMIRMSPYPQLVIVDPIA